MTKTERPHPSAPASLQSWSWGTPPSQTWHTASWSTEWSQDHQPTGKRVISLYEVQRGSQTHHHQSDLTYPFQSRHASWRHRGGDQRREGQHLRGDLPGRPQQRQHHHGGAERKQAAAAADDSRVHRVTAAAQQQCEENCEMCLWSHKRQVSTNVFFFKNVDTAEIIIFNLLSPVQIHVGGRFYFLKISVGEMVIWFAAVRCVMGWVFCNSLLTAGKQQVCIHFPRMKQCVVLCFWKVSSN